jgi:hypothetical protein
MFAVTYARPAFPGGSLAAPVGTTIWQETTGAWCRSSSQTVMPPVAV